MWMNPEEAKDPTLDLGLQSGTRELYEENLLYDCTLQVGEREFKVHKNVLAAISDYFRAMFCGSMVESSLDKIELKGLDPDAMSKLIELIYTGNEDIVKNHSLDILDCAMYLQMKKIIDISKTYLQRHLKPDNCFQALATFMTYSCMDEEKRVRNYIQDNESAVIQSTAVEDVPYDIIENLVEVTDVSEWDLFQFVSSWIKADESRTCYADDLMLKFRFCLLSESQLLSVKEMGIYLESESPWKQHIDQALEYQKLPTYQKVIVDSEQSTVKLAPTLGIFRADEDGKVKSVNTMTYNSMVHMEFTKYDVTCPKFDCNEKGQLDTVLRVNNFLIVCSDFREQKWNIFDARTVTWSDMSGMNIPRKDFAVAYHGEKLYAFGGTTYLGSDADDFELYLSDQIEMYDFKTNRWTEHGQMPCAMMDHAACTYGNYIYLTGGQILTPGNEMIISDETVCYDPQSGSWEKRSNMPRPYSSHRFFNIRIIESDVLAVLYRMLEKHRLLLDVYDPNINKWTESSFSCANVPPQHQFSNDSLLFIDEKDMYVFNIKDLYHENPCVSRVNIWQFPGSTKCIASPEVFKAIPREKWHGAPFGAVLALQRPSKNAGTETVNNHRR